MLMLTLRKDITLLVIIAAIFGGLLSPIFSFNLAFATSESEEGVEGDTGDGGSDNGGNEGNGGGGVGSQPELQPTPEEEQPTPTPEAAPEEGQPEAQPPIDPCEENSDAEGCEPPEPPDDDCLFNPSLPKCAPLEDGQCPDGFLMNEDGQCFPDKPCPTGFEKRDEDETGRCYPIDDGSPSPTPTPTPLTAPEPTDYCYRPLLSPEQYAKYCAPPGPEQGQKPPTPTPINIVIVTEINTQIRNYYDTVTTTTPTSCTTPQEKTISLGPGTMANKGIRVLAVFDPCRLVDGGAILNLPSNNNLKLLAVDLEGSGSNTEVHKAVVTGLQRIQRITNDQILYNVGFRGTVTGESPITDNTDTIQDINALFLWNDSPGQINFVDDNSMALNAVLSLN